MKGYGAVALACAIAFVRWTSTRRTFASIDNQEREFVRSEMKRTGDSPSVILEYCDHARASQGYPARSPQLHAELLALGAKS